MHFSLGLNDLVNAIDIGLSIASLVISCRKPSEPEDKKLRIPYFKKNDLVDYAIAWKAEQERQKKIESANWVEGYEYWADSLRRQIQDSKLDSDNCFSRLFRFCKIKNG